MSNNYNSTLQSNNDDLQTILNAINELPKAGENIELPELSNPATAAEVFANKELIDADGNKIVGTFTIDNELNAQDDLISQIQAAVDNLPEADGIGGSSELNLQDKTVTPSSEPQAITADEGYDALDTVIVNAIPSSYVQPSGTLSITANGTHDVKKYASVNVNVASGGGQASGVCPSLTITGDSSVKVDNIYYSSNNQYIWDFSAVRQLPIVINNIDIGKPLFLEPYSTYEPKLSNYNNLEIELDALSNMHLICSCTSTSPATLHLIDND